MIPFNIIVAVDAKLGIGRNGDLPWHLPSDLKYFKTITTRAVSPDKLNAVIMGRKTWDSIPPQYRPLPQRLNVVISRQKNLDVPDGVIVAGSLDEALELLAKQGSSLGEVFVIGGAQIFLEAANHASCQKLYVTRIDDEFLCDTFFPDVLHKFTEVAKRGPVIDGGIAFFFCEYDRNKS